MTCVRTTLCGAATQTKRQSKASQGGERVRPELQQLSTVTSWHSEPRVRDPLHQETQVVERVVTGAIPQLNGDSAYITGLYDWCLSLMLPSPPNKRLEKYIWNPIWLQCVCATGKSHSLSLISSQMGILKFIVGLYCSLPFNQPGKQKSKFAQQSLI